MDPTRELPIPEQALTDEQGFELARVWVANRAQHVSLRTEVWKDPATWGIMLVDLARHVARAYAQIEGRDQHEALDAIRQGMLAEFAKLTSKATGQVRTGRKGG